MNLSGKLRQGFWCKLGKHRGENFCISCGKQLAVDPFFPFRVYSLDGGIAVMVKALNPHHATHQVQIMYPQLMLRAQRVSEDEASRILFEEELNAREN